MNLILGRATLLVYHADYQHITNSRIKPLNNAVYN